MFWKLPEALEKIVDRWVCLESGQRDTSKWGNPTIENWDIWPREEKRTKGKNVWVILEVSILIFISIFKFRDKINNILSYSIKLKLCPSFMDKIKIIYIFSYMNFDFFKDFQNSLVFCGSIFIFLNLKYVFLNLNINLP